MGLGVSLFLIAVGLILWLAINVDTDGRIDINMIGVILVIVGAIGMLLSMIFWSSWGGFGGVRRETTVTRDDPYNRPPPY
jgi:hypothetical protein